MDVASIHRSLEQELFALLRGASLECLVCGEFVMRVESAVVCPECQMELRHEAVGASALEFGVQAG